MIDPATEMTTGAAAYAIGHSVGCLLGGRLYLLWLKLVDVLKQFGGKS